MYPERGFGFKGRLEMPVASPFVTFSQQALRYIAISELQQNLEQAILPFGSEPDPGSLMPRAGQDGIRY